MLCIYKKNHLLFSCTFLHKHLKTYTTTVSFHTVHLPENVSELKSTKEKVKYRFEKLNSLKTIILV